MPEENDLCSESSTAQSQTSSSVSHNHKSRQGTSLTKSYAIKIETNVIQCYRSEVSTQARAF
jgi:hypothetical protein